MPLEKKPQNRKEKIADIKTLRGKAEAYNMWRGESNFTSTLHNLAAHQKRIQDFANESRKEYERLGGKDIHTFTVNEKGEKKDYDEEKKFKGLKAFYKKHISKDVIARRNRLKEEYRKLANLYEKISKFLNQEYKEEKRGPEDQKESFAEDVTDMYQRIDSDKKDIALKKEAEELLSLVEKYYSREEKTKAVAEFATSNTTAAVLEYTGPDAVEPNIDPLTGQSFDLLTGELITPEMQTNEEIIQEALLEIKKPDEKNPEEEKPEEEKPEEEKPEEVNPEEEKPEEEKPEEVNPDEVNPDEGKASSGLGTDSPEEVNPEGEKPEEVNPEGEKPDEVNPDEGKASSGLGTDSPEEVNPEGEKPDEVNPDEGKASSGLGTDSPEEVNPEEEKPDEEKPDEGKLNSLDSEEYLNKKTELTKKLDEVENKYTSLNSPKVAEYKRNLERRFAEGLESLRGTKNAKIGKLLELVTIPSNDNFSPVNNSTPDNLKDIFELDPAKLNFTTDQEEIAYTDMVVRKTSEILEILKRQLSIIREIKKSKTTEGIEDLENTIKKDYDKIEVINRKLCQELAVSREAYSTYVSGYPESLNDPTGWIGKFTRYASTNKISYIEDSHPDFNAKLASELEEGGVIPFEREYGYSAEVTDSIGSLVKENKLTAEQAETYKKIRLNKITEAEKNLLESIKKLLKVEGNTTSNILSEQITEEDIRVYEEVIKRDKLTSDETKLIKKVEDLLKESRNEKKNPEGKEAQLAKVKRQLEASRIGDEAELEVNLATSKQKGVFGVLTLPKWSIADKGGVDSLAFVSEFEIPDEDNKTIISLVSRLAGVSYKKSLTTISDKKQVQAEQEGRKKYLGGIKEELKFYQDGQQTNTEILQGIDSDKTLSPLTKEELNELSRLLLKYEIRIIPLQIKNVIKKDTLGRDVTISKNTDEAAIAVNPLIISYNPLDVKNSPYLEATGRPDDLPFDPLLKREPDIPKTISLNLSIAMALQCGEISSTYNTPDINTGYRFSHRDIELDPVTPEDSHAGVMREPRRDLIAKMQAILN